MRQYRRVDEFRAYLAHHEDDEDFAALEARTRKAIARFMELRDEWLTWLGDTWQAAVLFHELLGAAWEGSVTALSE